MNLTYAIFSDKGDREINEDSVGKANNSSGSCFILCDGLGGHGMGDVASKLVVNTFKKMFIAGNTCSDFLEAAFQNAQKLLMKKQVELKAMRKMKTTTAAVVIDDKKAYIGYIGDSRVYVFRKNKMKKRTLDHSIPQMLVFSKEIKENEIRNHPDRNILLRVMGIEWDEPMYEIMKPIVLKKDRAFLLCSDGFWELIEEDRMCALLEKAESVDDWVNSMAQTVKNNGANRNMDNYSAIAIWVNK